MSDNECHNSTAVLEVSADLGRSQEQEMVAVNGNPVAQSTTAFAFRQPFAPDFRLRRTDGESDHRGVWRATFDPSVTSGTS